MVTRSAVVVAVALAAGSASAQPDMLITVDNVAGDDWSISAEFLSPTPFPVVQIWMDTSFDLTGDGSPITIGRYNPSYDTMLGNAVITNGPTASFRGNSLLFFGEPDPSNPLFVLEFEYAGGFDDVRLGLVGQNSAILANLPPSPSIDLYQDAAGNPGNLTWDVRYIPTPATLALAPLASMALVATRRRRN
ncbi:MAG: hypothetical protein AAFS11_06210 [Planctomycetota bacterium]